MHNNLIQKVANLMSEQTAAYARLESATKQLSVGLVRGEPNLIEPLTKAGEAELLRMRARLLEITSVLTSFAELRARESENFKLNTEIREQFDMAARNLLEAARNFQKISEQTTNLALGGAAFASACIQMCGISPTTYNAPVLRFGEGSLK